MEIMSVGPTIDCSVDTKNEIVEPGFPAFSFRQIFYLQLSTDSQSV